MFKLHSDKAKNQFRLMRPQLANTLSDLRRVLEVETVELVSEQVPMKVFDETVARKVSGLLLQRYDDITAGLLTIDK